MKQRGTWKRRAIGEPFSIQIDDRGLDRDAAKPQRYRDLACTQNSTASGLQSSQALLTPERNQGQHCHLVTQRSRCGLGQPHPSAQGYAPTRRQGPIGPASALCYAGRNRSRERQKT